MTESKDIIKELMVRVRERAEADPAESWTATLMQGKYEKLLQKWGEETAELIIAATQKDKKAVIHESADVLYHLLVLWHKLGITPQEVAQELENRSAQSGIAEKKSR